MLTSLICTNLEHVRENVLLLRRREDVKGRRFDDTSSYQLDMKHGIAMLQNKMQSFFADNPSLRLLPSPHLLPACNTLGLPPSHT